MKNEPRNELSYKRKRVPIFLSVMSICLAVIWVGVVFFGVLKEFESESFKVLSGKKIIFSLTEEEKEKVEKHPKADGNETGYSLISLLVEVEDVNDIPNLQQVMPPGVTFGLPDNENNFESFKNHPYKLPNNFLIKLPLVREDSNGLGEIYPNIDQTLLNNKINDLFKNSKAEGVYNLGNDEFLEADLTSFANIISSLSFKNKFLLYGIKDKTTIFESDSENIFSVEACDYVIDLTKDNKFNMVDKLNNLEKLSLKNGKAILFVKIHDKNIPVELSNWLLNLNRKKIKIVPFSHLPKTVAYSHEKDFS